MRLLVEIFVRNKDCLVPRRRQGSIFTSQGCTIWWSKVSETCFSKVAKATPEPVCQMQNSQQHPATASSIRDNYGIIKASHENYASCFCFLGANLTQGQPRHREVWQKLSVAQMAACCRKKGMLGWRDAFLAVYLVSSSCSQEFAGDERFS